MTGAARGESVLADTSSVHPDPWGGAPRAAISLPLFLPGRDTPAAMVVCGLSAKRPFDADYETFFGIVVGGRIREVSGTTYVMPAFGEDRNVMCYLDDIYTYVKARSINAATEGLVIGHGGISDGHRCNHACRRVDVDSSACGGCMVASNDGIFKLKFVRRTVAVSVHIYRAAEGTLTAGKRNAIER